MVKKLIALGAAGAVLLSVSMPVLAQCYGPYCYYRPRPKVVVQNENKKTKVVTNVYSESSTGYNTQNNWTSEASCVNNGGSDWIKTGNSDWAKAEATVKVNNNYTKVPRCAVCGYGAGGVRVHNENRRTLVKTDVNAVSYTGYNEQNNSTTKSRCVNNSGSDGINTGHSDWASGEATVVVNKNVTRMGGGYMPI